MHASVDPHKMEDSPDERQGGAPRRCRALVSVRDSDGPASTKENEVLRIQERGHATHIS